jgi:hypothetical protein
MKIHYHTHHLLPSHAGGTDDPGNLVRVNRAMHAFLHKLRYQETGNYFDCCAANVLSGDWTVEQARREACKRGQDLSEKFLPAATQNIQEYNSRPFEERSEQARLNGLKQSKESRVKRGTTLGSTPYWNNGLNNKRSHTCPGEGYVPGKLPVGQIKTTVKKCPHCDLVARPGALAIHIKHKH